MAVETDEAGFENSDACLEPATSPLDSPSVFDEHVWHALGLTAAEPLATLVVSPSFGSPRMLSLHKRRQGSYYFKLTSLSDDLWGKMMQRMRERQGPVVSLSEPRQTEALADLTISTRSLVRDADPATAKLFARLWAALTRRAQVVNEAESGADGVDYYLRGGGAAGRTQSPRANSILGRAMFAAGWLSELVETPAAGDAKYLAFIRSELRDALTRTENGEPCVRPVHRR